MSLKSAYIECKSVNKVYRNKSNTVNALSDINLQISKGDFIILKGKSGAGKSTLLNILGGLIRPTTGTILIEGNIINEMGNRILSRFLLDQVGIIFQSFNLLPTYTAYENVEVALAPKGFDNKTLNDMIMPLFERFSLKNKIHLRPEELSVGQQQKIAIIRTLVKHPSIILADEPTGSVDDQTASEIIDSLTNLKHENGVTILLATHGTVPESIADRVYIIENGRLQNQVN
jgi:putative ABC transport system ATP-binding protein